MRLFIFGCFLLCSLFLFSQEEDFIALKKRLESETDRQKIETYLDISELDVPRDTALQYLDRALILSHEIEFDSIYPIQFAKCASYFVKGEFEKAKSEIRKGYKTYIWTDYPKGTLGHINMLLGVFNEGLSEIDSAKFFYEKTIKLLKEDTTRKSVEILSVTYTNYASIYLKAGHYSKAIPIYLSSAKKSEEIGDFKNQLISINNAAGCFKEIKDYKKAIHYFNTALDIAKKTKDKTNIGGIYISLGQISLLLGENQKALKYLMDSKEILEEIGFYELLHIVYQSLSTYYIKSGNIEKAQEYLNQAKEGIKNVEDEHTEVTILTTQAEIDILKKRYPSAIKNLENAYDIAEKNNYLYLQKEIIQKKIEIFGLLEKYKSQAILFNDLILVTDSIFKKEYSQAITESETKYQTEKKEKENLALKQQNAEQELAVQQATNLNQRYGFIAGIGILSAFGIFYYSKNRRRKLLDEHIINLARAKQKEHEKIGADLHSTKVKDLEKIAAVLDQKGDKDLAGKTREIKDSIRLLSHELFQIPFSQVEFDDQVINLLFDYNSDKLAFKHDGIHTINWAGVENTIKRNLYLIISEAISNIKNHSKATEATVKFQKTIKKIDVTISDNGIGFTEGEIKNGHGIGNMRMRVNEINGTIRFDSKKSKGSEISIFISV